MVGTIGIWETLSHGIWYLKEKGNLNGNCVFCFQKYMKKELNLGGFPGKKLFLPSLARPLRENIFSLRALQSSLGTSKKSTRRAF